MTWVLAGLIVAAGLFFSGFFSGSETGIYCLSRLRLHLGVQQQDARALRLAALLDDEPGSVAVTLIGTNVMNYITTTAVSFIFADLVGLADWETEVYTVALLTPVVFVLGEVVPKNLFQRHADQFMMRGSLLLSISNRLLRATGAVWLVTRLASRLSRMVGPRPAADNGNASLAVLAPKRRVAYLLQEALAHDEVDEDQLELIERVVQLSETHLHTVMTPRNRVVGVSASAGRRELVQIAHRTGHAYLPVYDATRRHVAGIVAVDELLYDREWRTVADRLTPAVRFSPHESVADAISRMQEERQEMAVVTDRGGHLLGIVTLRDLLGEVVGEVLLGD